VVQLDTDILDIRGKHDTLNLEFEQFRKDQQDREKSCIRRQIAINIEYEIKCEIQKCISGSTHPEDIKNVKTSVYWSLPKETQQFIAQKFHQHNMDDLFNSLFHMKIFSDTAHPIEYNEQLVDYNLAKDIVNDTKVRKTKTRSMKGDARPLEDIIDCAQGGLQALLEIRTGCGDDQLLYNED